MVYYDRKNHFKAVNQDEIIVLDLIAQIRGELPGLGPHKLYRCLYQHMRSHGVKNGPAQAGYAVTQTWIADNQEFTQPRTTQCKVS